MISTTLNLLKEKEACESGYRKLREHVGLDFDKNELIPLTIILESNDLYDTLWVLDNAPTEKVDAKRLRFYFGAWCARQVLHIYEKEYPDDSRVRDCINATIKFANGEIAQEELSAARVAAMTAAAANAWSTAWATAWAAAGAAAGDAAWSARAESSTEASQTKKLKELLKANPSEWCELVGGTGE